MPIMPRIGGKPQRIAYSIMGVPLNIAAKRTAAQREIDAKLLYKNGYRMK